MNKSSLWTAVILVSLCSIANQSYACTGIPVAVIKDPDPKYISRYEKLEFDGSLSCDNDPPPEGGDSIVDYRWHWPDEAEDPNQSLDNGKTGWAWFTPPGECQVGLDVKDDENIWSPLEECTVRIVEVTLSGGGQLVVGDIVEIDLSVNPTTFPGEMKLTALGPYKHCIKVWKEETKQTLLIGDGTESKTWNPPSSMPTTLWVEGISPTGATTEARLSLLYDPPSHPSLTAKFIDFTVVGVGVGVEILYCYDWILMYTGEHADDTPTQNCVAIGRPSGGSYSWECSTTASGMLGIVSGQNTDTAKVKGIAASSSVGDAKITVSYTLGGETAEETGSVTVRRPAQTLVHHGDFDWENRTTINYFHKVRDQFGESIGRTGMPCDEVVTCEYGLDENVTSPADTAIHDAEKAPEYPFGNWEGGIAVKDVLGCPTTQMENSKYKQKIYIGGWLTWPTYYIYMQPLEDDPWPCIWKTVGPP